MIDFGLIFAMIVGILVFILLVWLICWLIPRVMPAIKEISNSYTYQWFERNFIGIWFCSGLIIQALILLFFLLYD
jgi:MFS superfamily sulfate permease-like transporter